MTVPPTTTAARKYQLIHISPPPVPAMSEASSENALDD